MKDTRYRDCTLRSVGGEDGGAAMKTDCAECEAKNARIKALEDAIVEYVRADDEYEAVAIVWDCERHRKVLQRVQAADKVLREIAKGVQR